MTRSIRGSAGDSESPGPSAAFWSYWHTWDWYLTTGPGEWTGSAVAT